MPNGGSANIALNIPLHDAQRDLRSPDPLQQIERKQSIEELTAALDQLKEEYRAVLVLRFLMGLSVAETAAVLGRSEGAIRVLQYRALRSLRKVLRSQK